MPIACIAPKPIQRDLRIDFFRGLVLLIILIEHIEWQTGVRWLVHFAPHVFGPINAIDIFVFLSGYVFGLVYSRVLILEGYWPCLSKALRRAWQLYIANLAIFFLVLTVILWFSLEQEGFVHSTRFREVANQPALSSVGVLALIVQPYNLDILPLYIVLLALAPIFLVLLSCDWRIGLLASYLLYATTQFYPSFNLPLMMSGRGRWIFNPFSWQLMFTIAMALSVYRESNKMRRILNHQWVLWISTIALVVITSVYLTSDNYTGRSTQGVLPWIDKSTLGPLRLFYFLCLVRMVSICLPASANFLHAKFAVPIVNCGQHSLPVFCLGVILTYACVACREIASLGHFATKAIEMGAIGLSVAFAYLLANAAKAKKTL